MTENRESFLKRLEPFLAPSVLLDAEHAYFVAKGAHRYQVRKELGPDGKPIRYFEHCRGVALILIDETKIVLPEMIIAALCHDTFEDSRYIRPLLFEHIFGKDPTTLVQVLSKCPPEGYIERFWMCTDWRPYVIKGCDRLHNLRSLAAGSREFRARQVAETREKYYPLFDRMVALAPAEHKARAQWLHDAIIKEAERQAALLEVA